MSTLVWKIPSIDTHTKQLLCHGYIRDNCPKYIIEPIIQIFAKYYNTETFTLKDIKNAAWLQRFQSPIYTFGSFDCYIELYPNGSNKHNEGKVMVYLCLVMMPKNMDHIFCSLKVSLQETNTSYSSSCTFRHKNWYHAVWNAGTLILAEINHLNQLTFTVKMTQNRIKLLDADSISKVKIIESKEPSILLPPAPATYKYTISDADTIHKLLTAELSEHFMSPIMTYGPFEWYLQIKPKHQRSGKPWIGFSIWYLPPNIVKFLCKIRIIFNDLTLLQFVYKQLDDHTIIYGEMDELPSLNEYTFMVDVAVMDILYDDDDMDRLEVAKFDNVFRPIAMDKLLNFQYEWKIAENKMLKQIKNASNVFAFISPIFEAYSLKWYISCSPNGSRTSRKNSVNIFLIMVSFPSVELRVPIKFDLEWVESGKIFTAYHIYTIDLFCDGESIWPLQTADIENLDTFTIKVKVCIADIFQNDKSMKDRFIHQLIPKNITVPTESFEWIISKETMQQIKSKVILTTPLNEYVTKMMNMFGMRWKFMLYPTGDKIETKNYVVFMICLIELPSVTSIVCVRYTIFVQETDTKFVGEAAFRNNQMISSWGTERILSDTFKSLDQFTIKIDMELIDVYEHNHYRTTNKFISKEHYNQLRQQKNGNKEIMRLEIDELEFIIYNLRTLNKDNENNQYVTQCNIDSYDNDGDDIMDELKNWFFNDIKMPQYYQQFVNAGITDLEMMQLLNEDDLIHIGVCKSADITKLLIEITLSNL